MLKQGIILVLIFWAFISTGQNLGEIVSPLPGDTVINGQLLVVFRMNPDIKIKPSSLNITIDAVSYKSLLKQHGNKISILVTTPIKKGLKHIRIKAKSEDNIKFEQHWDFVIRGANKNDKDINPTRINAALESSSRFTDVHGDGASLRQEPPEIHQLKFHGQVRHGKLKIPLKLYITNQEQTTMQARNRFYFGINAEHAGVFFGDINPNYHPMTLNGTRVRGIETFINIRSFRFDFIYGTVNRPVEGLRLFYNSKEDPTFAPINLQGINYDSTQLRLTGNYNNPGTYKRRLVAARFSLGSPNTANKFHLVLLKSTDDTNSIQYGGQASQNVSLGIDLELKNKTKRLSVDAGLATAFTTRDIRYGIASTETINALYGVDFPVDPGSFRKILVINSTTNIPSVKHLSFLSYYLKPAFRFANQQIQAEISRIGSGFESFGNPYLINDRFIVAFNDRMHFFKNHLFFQFHFRHYNNNLSKNDSLTRNTDLFNISFNQMIKPGLPRINGGFMRYYRTGKHIMSKERFPQYKISNYYVGIISDFEYWKINNSITLNYNFNQRNYIERNSSILSHALFINLRQDYSFGITVDLQYNLMLLTNDTSRFSRNSTYGLRLGYHTKNNKFRFSLGAMNIYSLETAWLPESIRNSMSAIASYEVRKNFIIHLDAGKSDYSEINSVGRNYNEKWGQIGLRYRISR